MSIFGDVINSIGAITNQAVSIPAHGLALDFGVSVSGNPIHAMHDLRSAGVEAWGATKLRHGCGSVLVKDRALAIVTLKALGWEAW